MLMWADNPVTAYIVLGIGNLLGGITKVRVHTTHRCLVLPAYLAAEVQHTLWVHLHHLKTPLSQVDRSCDNHIMLCPCRVSLALALLF